VIKKINIILIPLLLAAFSSYAYTKTNVYVNFTSNDSVGGRLTYAIKECIRRSAGMSLSNRIEDALVTINIVTLDPDNNTQNRNIRTVYSAVWTSKTLHETPVEMYLTNTVGTCGSNKINECAEDLAAETDKNVNFVKEIIQNIISKSE
jgi:hypothetical protein